MAIRPTDLQLAIVSAVQSPPAAQRAEENPRIAQGVAQAAFAGQVEERNERVAETGNMRGNRIEVNERQQEPQEHPRRRRRHQLGTPFEEPVAEQTADPSEPPHLIDFTA
jgi:hypothetical protein